MRLTPTDWRTLERIFEADGWHCARVKGSHRSYTKPGFLRPIVIPMYGDVGVDIIMGLLRTAKMSRERYFELMDR
jgi:predicted RNA binding protein YcfA (HicA-like mRNA interferase family)